VAEAFAFCFFSLAKNTADSQLGFARSISATFFPPPSTKKLLAFAP
jgi:hypothetical protein